MKCSPKTFIVDMLAPQKNIVKHIDILSKPVIINLGDIKELL